MMCNMVFSYETGVPTIIFLKISTNKTKEVGGGGGREKNLESFKKNENK